MELDQRRLDIAGTRSIVLTAPIDGQVAALQSRAGQAVGPDRPVMVVLGDDARLDVELFAPSRAIGFARVGERVRLMYDAFPYQQFGTFGGTVPRISRPALSPAAIAAPLSNDAPPSRTPLPPTPPARPPGEGRARRRRTARRRPVRAQPRDRLRARRRARAADVRRFPLPAIRHLRRHRHPYLTHRARPRRDRRAAVDRRARLSHPRPARRAGGARVRRALPRPAGDDTRRHIDPRTPDLPRLAARARSEEHTSELQSLMRNSYAVFCLTKKK